LKERERKRMSKREREYSEVEIDAFTEVCNICAGHAAAALSKIVDTKVEISVPVARILPLSEVAESFGGPEREAAGVYMRLEGACPGSILLLLDRESAVALTGYLTGKLKQGELPERATLSAFQEIGGMLLGSYLNALGQITKYKFKPLVPAVAVDMAGAIIGTIIADLKGINLWVFNVETKFKVSNEEIAGHIVMFPDEGTLKRITERLGISVE